MRGDRRTDERQSFSRQDASDASARALHRPLQGRDRQSLTCAQARRQLAAYRSDEWSLDERSALRQHVASCAECRATEAAYRHTGALIRHLPSITPPPQFREAVFAAIRADERRLAPEVVRLSRAATNPGLPVVRLAPRQPSRRVRRLPVAFAPRAALAAAAVLLVSLVAAKALPALDTSAIDRAANRLASGSQPTVARYAVDQRFSTVTATLATSAWLVYSATNAAGDAMLFAQPRRSGTAVPLLSAPTHALLTPHALTDGWAIWSVGGGLSSSPWSLYAARLSDPSAATPTTLTLHDSAAHGADTLATLGSVWASGDTVLIAGATADGRGLLLRLDLLGGTAVTSVVARSTSAGHLFTDPSLAGGVTYWADVWYDPASGLHSAIWQHTDASQSREISSDETSFHPEVLGHTLIWVDVSERALANMAAGASHSADANEVLMSQLNGGLEARDLVSGRQWEIAPRADVLGAQASGSVLIWRSDGQTHAYNLRTGRALAVDAQVRRASVAGATATTLVWVPDGTATLCVYDAA